MPRIAAQAPHLPAFQRGSCSANCTHAWTLDALDLTHFQTGLRIRMRLSIYGERLSGNGIGGKWLMGALLHIPLTLLGHENGAVEG